MIGSARRFGDESALIKSEIPIINVEKDYWASGLVKEFSSCKAGAGYACDVRHLAGLHQSGSLASEVSEGELCQLKSKSSWRM